jgi:uncharacterized OsmC-like protein
VSAVTSGAGITNGVDASAVQAVVERFRADPPSSDVPFGARVEWVDGYRTRAVTPSAVVAGDEPVDLAGTGTAPAPEELLLSAVGQCLVVGIVGAVSARGTAIEHLSVSARGRVDLAVAYGLADGHPGFSAIELEVDLRADLPREELDALVRQALARAPIPSTVSRPVPVTVELT